MGFAACLNKQGQFSATVIGDFALLPEVGRHVWKGKIANTSAELAEQVNGAIKSVQAFGDPFQSVEVVEIEAGVEDARSEGDKDSVIASLRTANRELNEVIKHLQRPKFTRQEVGA